MLFYLVLASVFIFVSGLIFAASMLLRGGNEQVNDRLKSLTMNQGRGAKAAADTPSLLTNPLGDEAGDKIQAFFLKWLNLNTFIEQSGVKTTPTQLMAVTIGCAVGFTFLYMALSPIKALAPFFFILGAILPFTYVWWRRKKRFQKFASQLPEALDLIKQALRAGQSLPAGIQLVGEQTEAPLGPEFARAFEEQNLGVALEDSLKNMLERIPNLDLQFFVTSICLQRQTGGDLAEILDKIGKLIRERFIIWGQIQALTGEGRLSGIVLLLLPPALFLVMLKLNYDYIMMLFNDPLGIKMVILSLIHI